MNIKVKSVKTKTNEHKSKRHFAGTATRKRRRRDDPLCPQWRTAGVGASGRAPRRAPCPRGPTARPPSPHAAARPQAPGLRARASTPAPVGKAAPPPRGPQGRFGQSPRAWRAQRARRMGQPEAPTKLRELQAGPARRPRRRGPALPRPLPLPRAPGNSTRRKADAPTSSAASAETSPGGEDRTLRAPRDARALAPASSTSATGAGLPEPSAPAQAPTSQLANRKPAKPRVPSPTSTEAGALAPIRGRCDWSAALRSAVRRRAAGSPAPGASFGQSPPRRHPPGARERRKWPGGRSLRTRNGQEPRSGLRKPKVAQGRPQGRPWGPRRGRRAGERAAQGTTPAVWPPAARPLGKPWCSAPGGVGTAQTSPQRGVSLPKSGRTSSAQRPAGSPPDAPCGPTAPGSGDTAGPLGAGPPGAVTAPRRGEGEAVPEPGRRRQEPAPRRSLGAAPRPLGPCSQRRQRPRPRRFPSHPRPGAAVGSAAAPRSPCGGRRRPSPEPRLRKRRRSGAPGGDGCARGRQTPAGEGGGPGAAGMRSPPLNRPRPRLR